MEKRNKIQDPNKVGGLNMFVWSAGGASVAVQAVLLGYLQIYCTNALGLNALLVGTLLMISKIFDGVTDLLAGYLVDRTKTRWGKGRPYEFAVIGIWFCTWLLFSAPAAASTAIKCVWIVLCYTLTQSIFLTLKNAAGTVYMVRAFNNEQKYVKLNSWGGLLSVAIVIVFNVMFPTFYAKVINDAAGWSRLILFIAAPMTILGMLRFFIVKEKYDVDVETENKVSLKDIWMLMKSNKNIYPVVFLMLFTNVAGNLGVVGYYFLYIVKNVEISGVLSAFTIFAMITLAFYPALLKRISVAKLIKYAMMLSIVSGAIAYIALDNFVLLVISSIIVGIMSLPASYMSSILVVECADYNEWQNRPRLEGTISSTLNFATKIGAAMGSFVTGLLLTAAGFDGSMPVQPDSAISMIRICYAIVPTVFYLLSALALNFYKLDNQKEQIQSDLAQRRNEIA